MTEAQLQAAIIECAKLMGWKHFHVFDSRRSERGFPDLVLVRPPRIVFAELKSARGRLTDEQKMWMGMLAKCPMAETAVWKPADWTSGEVERVLR